MSRPKTTEPRVYTAFRCSPVGRTWLDDLVVTEKAPDLSTVIRTALAVAKRHEAEVKMLLRERNENP